MPWGERHAYVLARGEDVGVALAPGRVGDLGDHRSERPAASRQIKKLTGLKPTPR